MPDSIILLGPIEVNPGVFKCVNHEDEGAPANYNFTDPILGGTMPSSDTARFGLTGDDVYNVYRADGTGFLYESAQVSGSLKFGVTPCAEKIDIAVKGAADIYGNNFDTLTVVVDGTTIGSFASSGSTSNGPPFDQVQTFNTTLTHNFTTPNVCGHIVEISGQSGTKFNNGVGYDVGITVTLRTTQLPT